MHVVSVINYKGGVGKTTITANLSAELAARGKHVLMIDLDPQTNLTFSFIKPEIWTSKYAKSKTIKNWYESFENNEFQNLEDLVIFPQGVNKILEQYSGGELFLISSHLDLINIDLVLAQDLGGANLQQSKKNFLKVHRRLAKGIHELKNDDDYDYVIIDCPPNFSIVTKTAIVASSHILIPARPDYLSTIGIDYLIRSYNELIKDYNEYINLDQNESDEMITPKILGVIFNMVQVYREKPISVNRPIINQTKKLGLYVFDAWIRESKTLHSEALNYGIPLAIKPDSSSQREDTVKEEIENFVDEFEVQIEKI